MAVNPQETHVLLDQQAEDRQDTPGPHLIALIPSAAEMSFKKISYPRHHEGAAANRA